MDDASVIPGVRDFYLLLIMPILAYWLSASLFHLFDRQGWFKKYRIQPAEAGKKRNRATLPQVFRQVLAIQVVQVAFALFIDRILTDTPDDATQPVWDTPSMIHNTTWPKGVAHISSSDDDPQRTSTSFFSKSIGLALQFACAVLIADLWQYSWHRAFHNNKFLFKHVHSVHHRLSVPYSYGALYSSHAEAFIEDTVGTTVTLYLSGLSILPATWFASLSVLKSVNDHSGYRFPYNPFDYVSKNTTEFHDNHHQSWGMKYNYSQVYFTIWDDLLGTTMSPEQVALRRKARVNPSAADSKEGKEE